MKINKEKFGTLKTGEEIIKYKLKNKKLQVNVLNYGGIITEIYTPDRKEKKENVVLGFDNLQDYEERSPYFGAIIGRHAGRISKAEFEIEGVKYQLADNEGNNNIHGGIKGLDKRIWKVEEIDKGIKLSYISPHLEEGFPGKVEFEVRYILEKSTLIIEYWAQADRKTIINLTNHSYFNLSGKKRKKILDSYLQIKSEKFLPLDKESIPTGEFRKVADTPFDFREPKRIGSEIEEDNRQLELGEGYDHPFVLEEENKENIVLKEEESGRGLSISTDQPAVIFYSANKLEGMSLSEGEKAYPHLAVCLETQDYPDAVNNSNLPTCLYGCGNEYTSRTEYEFFTF